MPTGFLRRIRHARSLLIAPLIVAMLALGGQPAVARVTLDAPTELVPDGISLTGTPILEWVRVDGAQSYAIELSTSSTFDDVLWTTSTTNHRVTPNRQLDAGTIYWRVRALAGSTASEWSSASFDRDALAGPTLLSPAPGTVLNQPEEPALVSWTSVDGAVSYTVQVSTDQQFADPGLIDEYTSQTSSYVVPDPAVAQLYYWRVRATLGAGILSQWSEIRDYQIGGLAKPVLTSPEDGPFTNVDDIVLDWEPVLGAKTYNLQVSTDQNFSDLNLDVNVVGVTGTRYSPPTTLANDQYYWRVQPVDALGNKLDWGSVDSWTFRRAWPDQPALEYPADDDIVGEPFFYQWSPVHLASSYVLDISKDSDFNTIEDSCTTVSTVYVPSNKTDCFPTSLGSYYWRITAVDAPGTTPDRKLIVTDTISAQVGRFTFAPETATPLSPADGETVDVPTLRWAAVPGAAKYKVTISAMDGGVGGGAFTTTGTSYTPRIPLSHDKSYRWQVQPVSASGREGSGLLLGSQPTFTVGPAIAPTESTPEPLGVPDPSYRFPTLSWTPVVGATGYKILVRRSGTFGWYALTDKFGLPAGEDDTESWLSPGDYEWQVEAYAGSNLLSTSSSTSTYTILGLDPASGERLALTGTAVSDIATTCAIALPERCADLRQTPVLTWAANPDAGSYKVYLSRDEEMTNILSGYPKTVESPLFHPVAALPDSQAGSAYYWFVQPCKTLTQCAPMGHATHAFNKLSKPVEPVSPAADEVQANDITFTWRDYLLTNQDPAAFPLVDPSGANDVSPRLEARQYKIQVSSDSNFQTLLDSSLLTVDQTTYTSFANTYPEGPLYWRVQAIDGSGNSLAWSAGIRFFKTSPIVTPLEPRNGETVGGSVPFRWAPLTYAASYDIEVFKNADSTGSIANRVLAGNSKQVAFSSGYPLPVSTLPYTWRVRSVDAKGRPGRWTSLQDAAAQFMVVGVAPTLVDPSPDVYVHANDALFTWLGVSGVTSYRFERRKVGAANAAESVVTPGLAWAPKSIISDGSWEWRVSALDTAGKAVGSSEWRRFLVDGTPPQVTTYSPQGTALRTTNFVARFSEPVSGVTGKSFNLKVAGSTTLLLAKVTLNAAGTKAVLNPTADLKPGKSYTLKLTRGIRDAAGNRLAPLTWTVIAK